MKLTMNPLLAIAWRGPGRVQIGVDPTDGFILDGVSPGQERILEALTAGTDTRALRRLSVRLALPRSELDELLDVLTTRGALLATAPNAQGTLTATAAGLPPDPDPERPWQVLQQRAQAQVLVIGGGNRVGLELLRLLRQEGVGRLVVDDDTRVTSTDVLQGPYTDEDIGLPRMRAVSRHLPGVTAGRVQDGLQPTLAVLISDWALAPHRYDPLLREDIPHLAMLMRDRGAQIGPYVLPGVTGCLRCTELYRADRDPDWITVLAQLGERECRGHHDLLSRLATTAACTEILQILDGRQATTYGASLELSLTTAMPTVRAWPAHVRCGCTWDLLSVAQA